MDTKAPQGPCARFDLDAFRQDCVRDLAWAVFSPPMVSEITTARGTIQAPNFELTAARKNWLLSLDANPSPLLKHLQASRSRFLGIYFEALWKYFLSHDSEATLLSSNQQMIEDGRTLGELDIIYYCHRRNITVHLELAVKFYLGMPVVNEYDLCSAQFWLGPNCADRLDLKISHLSNHQFALLDHKVTRNWLDSVQLRPESQEIAMHGYLYYPWPDVEDFSKYSPQAVNTAHLTARWLRATALTKLQKQFPDDFRFRITPRLEWLCAHEVSTPAWHDFATLSQLIRQEFNKPLRQPVLCEVVGSTTSQATQRVFVAPDDWPALHWPKRKF